MSLPSRERELKPTVSSAHVHTRDKSLPSRERELKLSAFGVIFYQTWVAPLAGARIETLTIGKNVTSARSLPSRERELKL